MSVSVGGEGLTIQFQDDVHWIEFQDAHVVGDNDNDDDDEGGSDDGNDDCYDDVDGNLPAPDAPVGGPRGSPSLFWARFFLWNIRFSSPGHFLVFNYVRTISFDKQLHIW